MDIPEVNRTSPLWRTKYGALIAVFGIGVALVGSVGAWLISPVNSRIIEPVKFSVGAGEGTITIARHLKSAGLIRNEQAFSLYVNLQGDARSLKAGTYLVSPAMSTPAIADLIASGKGLSDDIVVTIPEGSNAWEIDPIVASASALIRPGQFSAIARSKEGTLFPETYRFAKEATIADIVARMTTEFHDRAGSATSSQLIIASMLEKEAKTADDMALVAGIIAKRTELGMPLQIDATVGYGWCLRTGRALCDVTQAPIGTEIKVDGPYNTYTRRGLPIGPISNPGLQALNAAMHPKASDYLYYLSTRDGSSLVYARTLAEHLQNRQKYLGF